MKLIHSISLGILLLSSSIQAEGFGFNIGPFSLQFNADVGHVQEAQRVAFDPICYAISRQNRLELVVEGSEKLNAKEMKIVTRRLVIEPYAFGKTREGKPILQGNVIEDKLMKEITVKYGEDKFDETTISNESKEKGFFSGWFKSDKSQNVDIRKVSNIQVIEGSHFDAPKNFKGIQDDNVQVICQLPITSS